MEGVAHPSEAEMAVEIGAYETFTPKTAVVSHDTFDLPSDNLT
jgi:hypothetical protein